MARGGGGGEQRPLVVKRVIVQGHGGHHGGAWKVAYADFVTAMMAFFLLLWLISSASDDTLKGLSEYFSEAQVDAGRPGGSGGLLEGRALLPSGGLDASTAPPVLPLPPPGSAEDVEPSETGLTAGLAEEVSDEAFEAESERREAALFEQARAAIAASLEASPELRRYADNLLVDQTPEGTRIQIVDRDNAAMFPVGSDQMYPHTRRLLEVVVRAIADLPKRVSVRGHTDALPFATGIAYDNWRLSSDRANVTRHAMVELGLPAARIADVTGKADVESLVPEDPKDPRNRRISLVLLPQPGTVSTPEEGEEAAAPAAPSR